VVHSKRKGASGELEATKKLFHKVGLWARRGQQHKGTPDSPDIETELSMFHFEVKRTEKLRLYDAIEQAIKDAGDSIPVVLHRRSRKPWLAIMLAEDAIQLFRKELEVENGLEKDHRITGEVPGPWVDPTRLETEDL
jgi:hypothetical protein